METIGRVLLGALLLGGGFAGGWLASRTIEKPARSIVVQKPAQKLPADVCEYQYGVPCSRIPAEMGPVQADAQSRSRACSNGVFVDRINGRWSVAKDSRVDGTGEMIATACVGNTP